jgi:putative PIN family toxin of toxin-antitoxin system
MRIVVDTNVFIGACLGSFSCSGVLTACLKGQATALMGTALLTEYEAVLNRRKLIERSALSQAEQNELLDIVLARCQWVRIYYGWRPNLPDEADNHLMELAIAGAAQAIVSRNSRDLSSSELLFPAIAILSPEAFLTQLS